MGVVVMMWGDGWGWLAGVLMMLVFWGALLVLVLFVVRGFRTRSSGEAQPSDRPIAEETLAERFARGEISQEDFEQRGKVLNRGRS
jgi:putative membrane protein